VRLKIAAKEDPFLSSYKVLTSKVKIPGRRSTTITGVKTYIVQKKYVELRQAGQICEWNTIQKQKVMLNYSSKYLLSLLV
jgi:hypothetical protein